MSRRGFEDGSESGSGEEESSALKEVREFKSDRKRQKQQQQRDGDDEQEDDAKDGDGEDGDLMFEKRADGSRKIIGVDGEEDALYRRTDLADLEKEMGTKLEPFNLKAEMEMGHFDESGHFVERGFNQSDAWLEEMDEANAQVIGGAKRRFVKPLQLDEEPQGRDEGEAPKPTTGQLAAWADELRKMLLDDKETVAALLKRLAEAKRQKRGKSQHVKSDPLFARPVARHKDDDDDGKDAFDKASSLADLLLGSGQQSVFSFRKKDLLQWRRQAKVFEYVIRGGGANGSDSEVFGPFSGDQIMTWIQQGYFQSNVDIRIKIGPNKGKFINALQFDLDRGEGKAKQAKEV